MIPNSQIREFANELFEQALAKIEAKNSDYSVSWSSLGTFILRIAAMRSH